MLHNLVFISSEFFTTLMVTIIFEKHCESFNYRHFTAGYKFKTWGVISLLELLFTSYFTNVNYLCKIFTVKFETTSVTYVLQKMYTQGLYTKIEVNSARRVLQGSLLTGKVTTLFHRTLTREPLYSILEGSTPEFRNWHKTSKVSK